MCVWLCEHYAHCKAAWPPTETDTRAEEVPKFEPKIVCQVAAESVEPLVGPCPLRIWETTGASYEKT
jgi:hypothetical protein